MTFHHQERAEKHGVMDVHSGHVPTDSIKSGLLP